MTLTDVCWKQHARRPPHNDRVSWLTVQNSIYDLNLGWTLTNKIIRRITAKSYIKNKSRLNGTTMRTYYTIIQNLMHKAMQIRFLWKRWAMFCSFFFNSIPKWMKWHEIVWEENDSSCIGNNIFMVNLIWNFTLTHLHKIVKQPTNL